MTFLELIKKFPNEKSIIDYFLQIRYPNGVCCNHCGSIKVYQMNNRLKVFNCKDCHNTFSPYLSKIIKTQ
jgi:transposase-like protein